MKQSPAWRIVLTVIVVLGLVALARALHNLDFNQIRQAFLGLSMPLLVLSFALSVLQVCAQIGRFHVLFAKHERPRLSMSAWASSFGGFLNSFTPLRAGDIYKVAVTREKAGVTAATSVTLAERVTDIGSLNVLAIMGGLGVVAQWAKHGLESLQSKGGVIFWAVALGVPGLLFIGFLLAKTRLRRALEGFGSHFWGILRSRRFVLSFLIALTGWIIECYAMLLICRAAGQSVSIHEMFAATFLLNIGIAVPVTVANVGVFEASLAYALTRFGVPTATALAVAVVHHAILFMALAFWLVVLVLWRLSKGGGTRPVRAPISVVGKAR